MFRLQFKKNILTSLLTVLSIILTVVTPSSSFAWPPIFGPEFVFTNDQIANTGINGSYRRRRERAEAKKLSRYLRRMCRSSSSCSAKRVRGKWGREWRFTLSYHHGEVQKETSIQISWDPQVVEVIMDPMTVDEMRSAEPIVRNFLFDSVNSVGLRPATTHSGHVNMGLRSAFQNDPELFLRFYVDHANHPEWELGVLGYDLGNAPPLSLLPAEQSDELQKIIREFEAGQHRSIDALADQIQMRVHQTSLYWNEPGDTEHFQALGLKTITGTPFYEPLEEAKQRVEFRGSYGQDSYEQFIRYGEFLERRLIMLKREQAARRPIHFVPSRRSEFTQQEQLRLFARELDRMGLSRQRYSILIPPNLREDFNSYRIEGGLRSCSGAFH